MSAYRPEFEAGLRALARVSRAHIANGYEPPVLVGGGAIEVYTNSAIATGDFDISAGAQGPFEEQLQRAGFIRPSGPGVATRGWIHPDLSLGFEVVTSTLRDGMADRDRLVRVDLGDDGIVTLLSIEDMIADRMGQFASGTARDMRGQAKALFDLHSGLDFDYMDRRIRYESGGDYGVEDLKD